MTAFRTYRDAEACCSAHLDGVTPEQIEIIRERRRHLIGMAAKSSSPVWFVVALVDAMAADRRAAEDRRAQAAACR